MAENVSKKINTFVVAILAHNYIRKSKDTLRYVIDGNIIVHLLFFVFTSFKAFNAEIQSQKVIDFEKNTDI